MQTAGELALLRILAMLNETANKVSLATANVENARVLGLAGVVEQCISGHINEVSDLLLDEYGIVQISSQLKSCGANAKGGGGFQRGNTCRKRGSGRKVISAAEANALQDYTGDRFVEINQALRSGKDKLASDKKLISLIDKALDKSPKYEGLVFRKIDASPELIEQLQKGKTFSDKAYMSTSKNKPRFYGSESIVMQIVGKSGVDISGVSHNSVSEQEVLFPRNAKFEVIRAERHESGAWAAILKEI